MSPQESILKRLKIIREIGASRTSQRRELAKCKLNQIYWINTYGWTYDPREKCTTRPFDLFPRQEEFIHWLAERDANKQSGLAEKSRDVGFTWLCSAYALHCWLFRNGDSTGFGSRKLDLVDNRDNPDSIFEKIRFLLAHIPSWMRPPGYDPHHHDKFCILLNPANKSTITGEGGGDIGRGGRKTRYIIDEAAYLPNPNAIDASLSQTTRVRIDVSTPNGAGNPFHTKRFNGSVPVFTFHWRDDPRKNEAWYEQEKIRLADPVIIARELDIDYSASIDGVCIPAAWVQSAVNLKLKVSGLPAAGWDVADEGKSANVLIVRHGPVITAVHHWARTPIMQSAHRAAQICRDLDIRSLNYDGIGVGAGIRGILNATVADDPNGLSFRPNAINVAEPPTDARWPDGKTSQERFRNLRAELWWKLRDRFEKTWACVQCIADSDADPIFADDELISIPDHPELIAQLSLPLYFYTETGKVQIESKRDMQKRGVSSPDYADALVLSFAGKPPINWAEVLELMPETQETRDRKKFLAELERW